MVYIQSKIKKYDDIITDMPKKRKRSSKKQLTGAGWKTAAGIGLLGLATLGALGSSQTGELPQGLLSGLAIGTPGAALIYSDKKKKGGSLISGGKLRKKRIKRKK